MGNSPIDLSEFARLADKKLDSVLEETLKPYKDMIGSLFGTMPLDKQFAELYDIGGVPDIPAFTGKLDTLGISPGYYTRIEPAVYAGMIQVTKRMIETKQYAVMDDLRGGLVTAFGRTQEKKAVKAFGYAHSSAWDFMSNEEGVSLCSTAHTTKSGASTSSGFSNSGTSALNKTTIQATKILFNKFRTMDGELYDSEPDALIVPTALADTAYECIGAKGGASSTMDPDTANGKINVLYKSLKIIPWLRLDEYSTKNWYMVDTAMMKKFLVWIDSVKPETNTFTDNLTFNISHSIRGVFGWGWRNWRFIYGQNVS